MTAGLLMGMTGMAWLTQIGVDTAYLTHVLPSMILLSVGMGLTFVPLSSTALTGVQKHDAGVASAMVNTTQQIGGSLGTALLNTIAASATTAFVVANGGQAALPEGIVHGYTVAFTWGAVIMAVAAIVTFTMIKPQKHEVQPSNEHSVLVG